jgi:carbamoyl-phosphate synthase small subunit
MAQKVYLTLANGSVYEAKPFGGVQEATAELVFTTSMTGYIETLTDPSYYGQIVVQTFPLIGNVGVIPDDFESGAPKLKGYIVRQLCQDPSNYRMEGNLDTFLRSSGVPGLEGLDTRALTKEIRESGVMNAHIGPEPWTNRAQMEEIRAFAVRDALESVSCGDVEPYLVEGAVRKVALWDFGAKRNIRRELNLRNCDVLAVPHFYTARDIARLGCDGVMLSNGPGDPASFGSLVREIRKVADAGVPIFGICLGHQLLALSLGAKTAKLKYGHRGANQPVKDLQTGRIYITGQNHGYHVLSETLPKEGKERMANINDGTCEGIDYLDRPAFSVQYHPEASGGPLDNAYLFDRFARMMDDAKRGKSHASR